MTFQRLPEAKAVRSLIISDILPPTVSSREDWGWNLK